MSVDRLVDLQKTAASPSIGVTTVTSQISGEIPPTRPVLELNSKQPYKQEKSKKKKKNKKATIPAAPPSAPSPPKDPLCMEEFFLQMDEVRSGLSDIEKNCNSVDVAHQIILHSISEGEIHEQEALVASYMDSTNKISMTVRERLKATATKTEELTPLAPVGSGDLRMRIVNHAAALKKFISLMNRFKAIQRNASSQHHAQIQRQYKIIKPEAESEELEKVSEMVGAMTLTSQQIFSLGQTGNPLQRLERMKERRKEVMDIEKGIVILNQLFIDMSNMLEEQGSILDNLESYLGETVEFTEVAEGRMQEAVETQKNIRRWLAVKLGGVVANQALVIDDSRIGVRMRPSSDKDIAGILIIFVLVMSVDLLKEFGLAKQQVQADGTAFEQADQLEKGATDSIAPSLEDELMHMQSFLAQSEEISQNTHKIDQLNGELDKLHKQALLAANPEESGDASAKIEVITAKVNQYSNKNRNMLKAIERENEQLREIAPSGSGHMRMRESKHRALATSFLSVTKKLQKMQQNYRDKYRQQLERQYKIVNPNATAEEISQITNDESGAQAKIFASAVKEDSKKTLSQMKDRFQDMKTIEKNILELHQLFLDLQTLVVEQGDMLNRIEFNVDKTVDYTEEAAQDMKQAVEYQKSIWKKKWVIVVLIIVGVVILILAVLFLLRPLFVMAANRSSQPQRLY